MRKKNLKEKIEKVSKTKSKEKTVKAAKTRKFTQKEIEKIIKDLTAKGKSKGFVTDVEIKSIFPGEPTEKVLNALYDYLADKNIEIVDSTKKREPENKEKKPTPAKSGKSRKKAVEEEADLEIDLTAQVDLDEEFDEEEEFDAEESAGAFQFVDEEAV